MLDRTINILRKKNKNCLYRIYRARLANILNIDISNSSIIDKIFENTYFKFIVFLNSKLDVKIYFFRINYCFSIFKKDLEYYIFSKIDKEQITFSNFY